MKGQCEETGTKPLQTRNIRWHGRNHVVVQYGRKDRVRLDAHTATLVEQLTDNIPERTASQGRALVCPEAGASICA